MKTKEELVAEIKSRVEAKRLELLKRLLDTQARLEHESHVDHGEVALAFMIHSLAELSVSQEMLIETLNAKQAAENAAVDEAAGAILKMMKDVSPASVKDDN